MPLIFGAVQPMVWSVYAAVMTGLFLTAWWRRKADWRLFSNVRFAGSVGLFLLFCLLQILPLPMWLLQYINPRQYRILTESSAILGIKINWHSLSYAWRESLAWWIFLAGLTLFAMAAQHRLARKQYLLPVVWGMLGLALAEALYGLSQTLMPTLGVLWADVDAYLGDARGTFINRNHFAGFLEMVWPLGLAMIFALAAEKSVQGAAGFRQRLKRFLSADHSGFQVFMWAAMLFILLSLLFSRSRAGITGAFIGGMTFFLLSYLGGKRFSMVTWCSLGLAFVFLLFYGHTIGFDKTIGRFLTLDEGTISRVDIWKDTLALIIDHPLGIGLNTYEQVMPVYNTRSPFGIQYTHAHNDYLEILAETGWPGLVFIAGGLLMFLGTRIRHIRKYGPDMDPTPFFLGVGACCGLISIMFHGFFDFNAHIPANLVYLVLLVVIGSITLRPVTRRSE